MNFAALLRGVALKVKGRARLRANKLGREQASRPSREEGRLTGPGGFTLNSAPAMEFAL